MTHTHPHHDEQDVSAHPHPHHSGGGAARVPQAHEGPSLPDARDAAPDARDAAPDARDAARIAYLDCFAGASGDMLLGALLDVGLSLDSLKAELAKLDLDGYELEAERKRDHGLTGTKLHVRDTLQAYPARHLHDIRQIIEGSTLSDRVKTRGMAVIERLGRAEAGIHGVPLEEVHFHEVGAVDTIVDVVGFVAGLELLGVSQVYASAIPLGSGTIQTAHGRLPVPVPATLALLASAGAPTVEHPAQTEIVTPTGAALLAQLAVFERPAIRVRAVGYGFGSKAFPWANALRVWIGDREVSLHLQHDEVVKIECNLDDVTGETLGYAMEQLFAAGALDVWFTPIQMKKNRPGVMLSVLSPADKVEDLSRILMRETSTLGVRLFPPAHRLKADRRMREVQTPWGSVHVKEKWLGEQRLGVSPEYEDCARLARESGESLLRVMNVARQIAER
ncbi:MAG: nickel pincer cofactor biosynthesis protein LarC [Anaerolineae bacterium]|nr:nickel pincer cofactor biosynthesis protein LarC [Anaerolineae bacterium]